MSQWSPSPTGLDRIFAKVPRKLLPGTLIWLHFRNLMTRAAVFDRNSSSDVSLTTIPTRLNKVHITIESIAAGKRKPRRIILWIDDPSKLDNLPKALLRQQRRGLEIRSSENFGPHTKYYPYVQQRSPDSATRLITADDDQIYDREWLLELERSARLYPDCVVAHRAHVRPPNLIEYQRWGPCLTGQQPSLHHFATGVSGVSYPSTVLDELRELGTGFIECAPRADDVWLHWVAVHIGIATVQCHSVPKVYRTVPNTQNVNLADANGWGGGNDEAIVRTQNFFARQASNPT